MGHRRRLLTVLFAVIALVLSMHQVTAASHVTAIPSQIAIHVDSDDQQNADHPMHSIGCCSFAIVLTIPEHACYLFGQWGCEFIGPAPDMAVQSGFRSEHFRPPRVPGP